MYGGELTMHVGELKWEILKSHDAIFNKQRCIAIMLLCLNQGYSEHKQKANAHGYSSL